MGFGGSQNPLAGSSLGISHGLEESADMAHVNFGGEATIVGSSILQLADQAGG